MPKKIVKILRMIGINPSSIYERIAGFSIRCALSENGMMSFLKRLEAIIPDISDQYSFGMESFNDYMELKIRAMHVFQCSLMLEAIKKIQSNSLTVVDIGDSAGTHMLYLQALVKGERNIKAVSVNLDPCAVAKIKSKGQEAILCRAEELDLGGRTIDLFTSFEMVEHLHNPAIFFRRLAKKNTCFRMVVTLPYLKKSRVGLYYIRSNSIKAVHAEEEHIFELSPEDWTLLFKHSGWKVAYSKIYYQYPRKIPFLKNILARFWREADFEGFWGCILEKDTVFSDCYLDWDAQKEAPSGREEQEVNTGER